MFSFKLRNLKFLNQLIFFKSKFYFFRMRRKNLKIFKFFDDRRIGAIPRIFLTSIFVVFSFYHIPSIINFANKQLLEDKEFQNNSKAILAYTLNKKEGAEPDDRDLNEKDLLIDIFSLNDLETDTVRLNASTIKQLFQDTDYKLDDVRETKLVKPVALTLLPGEIKMIESLPSLSIIKIADYLTKVSAILNQVFVAVTLISAITIIIGLIVISSAIMVQGKIKEFQNLVFKILGFSKKEIIFSSVIEFLIMFKSVILIAVLFAVIGSYFIVEKIFELNWQFDFKSLIILGFSIGLVTLFLIIITNLKFLSPKVYPMIRNQ